MYFSFVEKERINIAGKKVEIFALVLKTKKVEIMLLVCRSHVSKTAVNSVAGKIFCVSFV